MLTFRYVYCAIFLISIATAIFATDLPLYGRFVLPIFTAVPLVLNELQVQRTRKRQAEIQAHSTSSLEDQTFHEYRESSR